MTALTTNDVRVLRLLAPGGHWTASDIRWHLRHGLGADPALRRLPKLVERGLIAWSGPEVHANLGTAAYTATADGLRALAAADREAVR